MSRCIKKVLMASKEYVKHFLKVIYLHSVHPPFSWGVDSQPNFQKRGPDRISIFRGRLVEKRGDFFSRGREGSQLLHKK